MNRRLRLVSYAESKLRTEVLPSGVLRVIVGEDEQQQWSSGVDQEDPEPPHIKEEQEELWSSQEGEQLQGLEEADVTRFSLTPVPVKKEDDEEKPHQSPSEENTETQLPDDGDHCGGSEAASNGDDPLSLTHHRTSTSDPESDDSNFQKGVSRRLKSAEVNDRCHRGRKRFSCSECGQRFDCRESLKRHIQTHTGTKVFRCSVCAKTFSHRSYLDTHVRTHTGEKPFICSVCGKSFSDRGTVTRHMRTHTGEKPFPCLDCGRRFSSKENMMVHRRTHTGEKPFICAVCGKNFSEKGTMTRHMRTHTGEKPFVCSVCRKKFSERGSLMKHLRTHTGEKPFVCSLCGKRFAERGTVTRHMRTHTGEKPFSCSHCHKSFSWSNLLKRHTCDGEESNRTEPQAGNTFFSH